MTSCPRLPSLLLYANEFGFLEITIKYDFFQWDIMSWCKTFMKRYYSYLYHNSYGLDDRFSDEHRLYYYLIISLIKSLREKFI